jgi:predicted signal transduction protein with EAL and GGDEF domain
MVNVFQFSFAHQLEKKNKQLDHMLTLDPLTRAEDIRRRVANINNEADKQSDIALTLSLGLAQLRSTEAAQDWLGRADKAMYKAKAMGRNGVCFDADVAMNQLGKSSGIPSAL